MLKFTLGCSRMPLAVLILFPCNVQGVGAAETVIEAINHFNETKDVDLIIVTRGGGSYEDLIEFNSEKLAWTVFESDIPIISAVGHEIDYTIIDYVADLRAPTPSAAAELSVPHKDAILDELELKNISMAKYVQAYFSRYERVLDVFKKSLNAGYIISDREQKLLNSEKELKANALRLVETKSNDLINGFEKLEALNPLSVLMRGFAVASKDGKTLKSVNDIKVGETFEMKLKDGVVKSAAEEIIQK